MDLPSPSMFDNGFMQTKAENSNFPILAPNMTPSNPGAPSAPRPACALYVLVFRQIMHTRNKAPLPGWIADEGCKKIMQINGTWCESNHEEELLQRKSQIIRWTCSIGYAKRVQISPIRSAYERIDDIRANANNTVFHYYPLLLKRVKRSRVVAGLFVWLLFRVSAKLSHRS